MLDHKLLILEGVCESRLLLMGMLISVRQADRECMVDNNIQGNSPTTK